MPPQRTNIHCIAHEAHEHLFAPAGALAFVNESSGSARVIQFSMKQLTGGISGAIKRFDPREGSRGKALPPTSQNALMELQRWYHRPVR
jgi:hypothetical protein